MHMCMCMCIRVCVHLHIGQKYVIVVILTPDVGGTLPEPNNNLEAVFFVFVFGSFPNRRQTEGNC